MVSPHHLCANAFPIPERGSSNIGSITRLMKAKAHPHIHDSEHLFVEVDKLGGTVRNAFLLL